MALARMYTTPVVPQSEAKNLNLLLDSSSLLFVALTAPPREVRVAEVRMPLLGDDGMLTCGDGGRRMEEKGLEGGEENP